MMLLYIKDFPVIFSERFMATEEAAPDQDIVTAEDMDWEAMH